LLLGFKGLKEELQSEFLKERHHLCDVGVNGEIMLKKTLKEIGCDEVNYTLTWLRKGPVS
jgi:hypothetical protein